MVKVSLSRRTHRATSVTPHIWRPLLSAVVLLASIFYSASSSAQILGTTQLNTERRKHTATLIQNGMILIVGGENQSGIVSQAEISDPASLTSTPAPAAASPRTDHTATLLPDGRVLISGGRDQMSALDSTELYVASVNSFSSGPSLKRARSGQSATALADGKILIVGGDATGSAELYDPATQIFSLVSGNLGNARNLHSAVLLNNGQVLIVGGVNAQNAILNSAEIYDAASQSFHVPTNALQIPRALATLRLLPDGKVQVIGGDSDFSMEIFDPQDGKFNGVAYLPPSPELLGATLSTRSRAALVSPTASQNPNLLGTSLTSEQLDLLDRADQTITELPSQNKALVAGGVNSTGQVLNSASLVQSSPASVTTDKTDYAPGTIVTITGRGFQPNEDVAPTLHERPQEYADPAFVATADEQGNFIFMQFAPQTIDIGRTFTLTAIGQSSGFGAQTAFTDAVTAATAPQFFTVVSGTCYATGISSSPANAAVCAKSTLTTNNGNTSNNFVQFLWFRPDNTVAFTERFPSGTAVIAANSTVTGSSIQTPDQAGTWTVKVCNTNTGCSGNSSNTLASATINITASNRTLTITGSGAGTGTVTSTPSGINCTLANGTPSGTCSTTFANGMSVTLTATASASAPTAAGSTFNGWSGDGTGTTTRVVTMDADKSVSAQFKANQTITFGALSDKTYGDPDFAVSATASSGLVVSFSSLTTAKCTVSGNTVHIIEAGTCTIRALQAGDTNYNAAANVDQSFTINKKAASVMVSDASKIYGDADSTSFATINSGFVAADLGPTKTTSNPTRAPGENAGTYAITPSPSTNA